MLARLAYNYRWAWTPGGPELFRAVDPDRWERCAENPVRLLQEARRRARSSAPRPTTSCSRAPRRSRRASRADLARATEPTGPATAERPIAYFCAEYGFHGSLPIYSGGLGALAGDILKEASDRALPLVAVGLLYRHGYFRQRIDATGWQHEYWVDTDPDRLPAALVTGDDGAADHDHGAVGDREVVAQIWRVDVGRVPLFLLDADRPENAQIGALDHARASTSATRDMRLAQYVLLGIGGVRALEAHGDRARPSCTSTRATPRSSRSSSPRRARSGHVARRRRWTSARKRTIFTTHTPVPAGNDTYPPRARREALGPIAGELGVDPEEHHPPRPHEPRRGRRAVRRHPVRAAHEPRRQRRQPPPRRGRARDVARRCGPTAPSTTCRSRYVTNGVHMPTLARRADVGAARPPPRRGLARPRRRPRDLGARSTTSRTRSCGPRAASSAPRSSTTSRDRAWSTGSAATSRASTPRRRPTRSTRTC